MSNKDCSIWFAFISARLPLDEKVFERDLQAALQLSKESTEDDKDEKPGWTIDNCVTYVICS